jgi:PPOX class probable F420-dependent enzyme
VHWDEMAGDPTLLEFWTQRRVCALTTVRPDGRPHTVAVGATLDPAGGLVRIITSRSSVKAVNVRAAGAAGAPVSVCQVDGRRWSTVEGTAHVREEPELVAEAERRYALRYREPRPNPDRVAIEITVRSVLGRL